MTLVPRVELGSPLVSAAQVSPLCLLLEGLLWNRCEVFVPGPQAGLRLKILEKIHSVLDGLWVLGDDVHIVLGLLSWVLSYRVSLITQLRTAGTLLSLKNLSVIYQFWLSLRARGGSAGGGGHGAHQLPALLPCPTRGNSLCLQLSVEQ